MTWTEPKVDWTSSDEPTAGDFNNINGNLLHLYERMVPSGSILMWAGALAAVPGGWVLCDGNNGTPDLRDRFILGAAAGEAPGATGGSHTKTLTTTELPGHTHTFTAASAGAHTHTGTTGNQSVSHTHAFTTASGGSHTHSISSVSHSHGYRITNPRANFGTGSYVGERDGTQSTTDSNTHKHTAGTGGSHTHTGTTGAQSVSHTHNFTTGSAGSHTHTGTTGTTGSGQAFDIRPKYYKLAFIMKL